MTTTPDISLKNVPEKGPAPRNRLADAEHAQRLVAHLVKSNTGRNLRDTKIKGMCDGNPPFSQQKLNALGQKHRTNINFLEGKAALSSAMVPYYELFAGSNTYATVLTQEGDENERQKWSSVITEEFDRMLRDYPAFDFRMQALIYDFVGYGKGFLTWMDKCNWQFRHIKQQDVLVPDGEDAYVGDLEVCVVRQVYKVHQLYNYVADPKRARAVGWNVEATLKCIKEAAIADGKIKESDDFLKYQQRIKDNDLYEGNTVTKSVAAAHVFVREFDGKVSHYLVNETGDAGFLYTCKNKYEDMGQLICAFFLEIGDGSWNGMTGLGKDLYSPISIKNRLKCAMLDNAFLRASIALQPTTGDSIAKMSLIQQGPVTFIPPNTNVLQNTILGDVEGLMRVDFNLDNMLSANTGIHRQRVQKSDGNPITAEQARIDQVNSATLGNSAVNRFFLYMDKCYAETYRRASSEDNRAYKSTDWGKAALDFQDRCVERGVPIKAVRNVTSVSAYRTMGNGNMHLRRESVASIMAIIGMLPESGRANALQDYISANTGHRNVDRYYPSLEIQKLPNEHQADAFIENGILKVGAPVLWTPEQNNVIHLQVHLQAGAEAANTLAKGAQPVEVLAFLDQIGMHAAAHLKALQGDGTRKDIHKMLLKQFNELGKIADQIRRNVEAHMEQEQRDQVEMQEASAKAEQIQKGTDPAMIVKIAETEQSMKLKSAKAAQDLQIKQQKAEQKLAINDLMAAQKVKQQEAKNNGIKEKAGDKGSGSGAY